MLAAGLVASALDGWDGIVRSVWDLVRHPEDLYSLSVSEIAGFALVGAGFTIAVLARVTLRHSYSSTLVIRESHRLITHGVYRNLRHPIYSGVIMVCIGVTVHASSPYGLLIMSALVPIFLNRIRMEERILVEEYGDEYTAYTAGTSRLVPFIY